ncbi:MAG TPA: septal ring lytic transglycosylase RlpA family protein [Thermoanaerobaculia bacterium]
MRSLLLMATVAAVLSNPMAAGAQPFDWTVLELSTGPICGESAYPRPSFHSADAEIEQLFSRILRYTDAGRRHRTAGLASYYSSFFDGRKTANGEIFRNRKDSAAHLTLPLGTWIEVKARATGRTLRMRVNDRGPYAKKFAIDLSQAAARKLGVDRARDRYVEFRIIALPGESPLPEDLDHDLLARAADVAAAKRSAQAAIASGLTAE